MGALQKMIGALLHCVNLTNQSFERINGAILGFDDFQLIYSGSQGDWSASEGSKIEGNNETV